MSTLRHQIWELLRHPLTIPFYLPSLLTSFAQGMMILIMPLYAVEFDVSYGLVGVMLSSVHFGRLIGDVPAGVMLRQFGNKRVQILGVAGIMLPTGILFFVNSIWIVVGLQFINGFGQALYNISRHAYIAETVVIHQRGRTLSLMGGIHRVGAFSGPAVAGIMANTIGLRTPFLLYTVVSAVALALIITFLHLENDRVAETAEKHSHLYYVFSTVKAHRRILFYAGSAQLLAQMVRAGREVIIPLYAANVLVLDPKLIGYIISFAAAIDAILFPVAGWLMDRFGRKYAIVPCFLFQGLGMALVPLTGGYLALLILTGAMGFANGLGAGTMMTLGSDLAPELTRSEFIAVWRLIGDIGFMGGPLAVGGIADILVLSTAAVAIAGVGVGAAIIFAFFVPETLTRMVVPEKIPAAT
jgi:MFS family permease